MSTTSSGIGCPGSPGRTTAPLIMIHVAPSATTTSGASIYRIVPRRHAVVGPILDRHFPIRQWWRPQGSAFPILTAYFRATPHGMPPQPSTRELVLNQLDLNEVLAVVDLLAISDAHRPSRQFSRRSSIASSRADVACQRRHEELLGRTRLRFVCELFHQLILRLLAFFADAEALVFELVAGASTRASAP